MLTWDVKQHNQPTNIQVSKEISTFPAGDYKAAIKRQDSMTDKTALQTRTINNKNIPQEKHRPGTVSKSNILLEGLN